jgi:four helix bundle protein
MKDFRKLDVWHVARRLTESVYQRTRNSPSDETFGLRAQMRRASVSVCSNIAEGCGRSGDAEFARFLSIATGSASELECETIIALDLGFLDQNTHDDLIAVIVEVKRMLGGLLGAVRPSSRRS